MAKQVSPDVDTYIANSPLQSQQIMKELRALIKTTIPNVEERISWGIPFYRYHGLLSGYSVFKEHVSYGMGGENLSDEMRKTLEKKGYKTGKKIVQIRFDQKIPVSEIKQLLKEQVKINENKMKSNTL
jgi:uncharacterized protein YdhG (YjbR/CyaY superfamily)